MKITYTFVTGETVEIEVSDELGTEMMILDHQSSLKNRAETRRHVSLEERIENGFQIVDETMDLEETLENQESEYEWHGKMRLLKAAILDLQPQQQELVRRVFFEKRPIVDIARELGISKQACNNRLNKIYRQLKKRF